MKTKEIQRYLFTLSKLDDAAGINDCEDHEWLVSIFPKTLCKYRSFDSYAESMIADSVVYFALPEQLDDPSELVIRCDIEECIDAKKQQLTTRGKEIIEEEIRSVEELLKDEPRLNGEYWKQCNSNPGTMSVSGTFVDIPASLRTCLEKHVMQEIEGMDLDDFKDIREKRGICSLAVDPRNRELWNQYAENGGGYCVEYEIPLDKEHVRCLLPVSYGGNAKDSLMRTLIRRRIMHNLDFLDPHRGLILDSEVRKMSHQFGASWYQLFCQKDEKWSYQQEWRFLGMPCLLHHLRTKAIYLGWNVSEENRNLLLEAGKAQGFPVYQAKCPEEGKPLEFFEWEA